MTRASEGYFPLVYDELRKLAAAKLVHEAWVWRASAFRDWSYARAATK